jgi:hypothetical protein
MYPPAPLYSQIIKCPNIMVTANHATQKPHFHPPQFSEWQPKTKEDKQKQITFQFSAKPKMVEAEWNVTL